jgi:hypothetical protein
MKLKRKEPLTYMTHHESCKFSTNDVVILNAHANERNLGINIMNNPICQSYQISTEVKLSLLILLMHLHYHPNNGKIKNGEGTTKVGC